jgi:hypothetical protein
MSPLPSLVFYDLLACPMGMLLLILGLYIINIMCVESQMHSQSQVSHNTLPCSPSHHPPSHSSPLCCTSTQAYLPSPYLPPFSLPTISPLRWLYPEYHPIATASPPLPFRFFDCSSAARCLYIPHPPCIYLTEAMDNIDHFFMPI